jgi:hypothetical protein
MVYSAEQLLELSVRLDQIADWLRESCSARHADDMADVVAEASQVVEDLYAEAPASERAAVHR